MLAVLTEQGERSRGDWSNEHGTFDEVRGLMHRAEPLLPPAVRAALYRALTGLDSIASTGEVLTVAGRQVYGIDQLERGERQRILLDAQTGRVVGYSSVTTGGEVGWTAVWRHAVTPASGVVPDGF